ncbi:MAG: glycosyltransferase [Infirmifilum sp.]
MTKFLVILGTLNARGGRELLGLAVIKALWETLPTSEIYVLTKDVPEKSFVKTFPRELIEAVRYVGMKPLGIVFHGKLWKTFPFTRAIELLLYVVARQKKCITLNLNADSIPLPSHICFVHFPYFAVSNEKSIRARLRKIIHIASLTSCKMVLVNSNFTKAVLCTISRRLCRKTVVLHPPLAIEPIKLEEFFKTLSNREPIVLTVSRYSREKKLELVIEVARKVPEAQFFIVGSLSDKRYYEELKELVERYGLNNVNLLFDIPFSELQRLRRKAKIYLHTMPYEHFGIAIIEAMSQGLIPIVHKSGGPWFDILKRTDGIIGYGYYSIEEAVEAVKKIIHDEIIYRRMAINAIKQSTLFTFSIFKKKFLQLLRYL